MKHTLTSLPWLWCLFILAFLEHPGYAASARAQKDVVTSDARVIYLTPRANVRVITDENGNPKTALEVPAYDKEALRTNLARYLKFPPAGTQFTTPYDPDLQALIEHHYPGEAKRAPCPDFYQGDYIQRELIPLADGVDEGSDSLANAERMELMLAQFYCQAGQTVLTQEELRWLLLLSAINYHLLADPEYRDVTRFDESLALGTRDLLSTALRTDQRFGPEADDLGIWTKYTLQAEDYFNNHERIILTIDATRLVHNYSVYIDGEKVGLSADNVARLRLYPGRHYIQMKGNIGTVRSDIFDIPDTRSRMTIVLGGQDINPGSDTLNNPDTRYMFPPLDIETDELLWLALRTRQDVLPYWLKRALADYIRQKGLTTLYIVAPEGDRLNGPASNLIVASFTPSDGLGQVPKKLQGDKYRAFEVVQDAVPRGEPTHTPPANRVDGGQVGVEATLSGVEVPASITCTRPDAVLYVDGKELGPVARVAKLPSGVHKLRIYNTNDGRTYNFEMTIPQQTIRLHIDFKRLQVSYNGLKQELRTSPN